MEPGQQLGRYELVAELGRGGMGVVWEARLQGPAGFVKPVALKVLHAGAGPQHGADRAALVVEARLGALLSHPNVVSVLDLGEVDDRWYIAMELVRGPTVGQLARLTPMSPAAIVEVGVQACAGLAHVHALSLEGRNAGLVHRDIKLDNLLVDRTGLVKVADLGVAALRGASGKGVGTPGYMPPEQLEGKPEARSDLFALGVLLFRLTTGRAPFGAGRQAAWATVTTEQRLADPTFFSPVDAIVPGLAAIVHRCLRFDAADRWPTAGALGSALRELRGRTPGPGLSQVLEIAQPGVRHDEVLPVGPASRGPGAPSPGPPPSPPVPAREMVGREAVLIEVVGLLRTGTRLITLHGPGGVGKTRLAQDVALSLAEDHTVVWVGAAPARSAGEVASAVASALGGGAAGDDPVARAGDAASSHGPLLVVLDDLEGAAEAVVDALGVWVSMAPRALFLVTSRVRLRAPAERVVPVEPLAIDDAVALLTARLPTRESEAAVRALAARLDGLPLALELAAGRAALLGPHAVLQHVDERLRLLTSGGKGRHAGLRAMLDASWALLSQVEQSALARCSVFAGSFSIASAEAVVDLSDLPGAPWALEALHALVDHSLVQVDRDTGRLYLLETVRLYASEHLRGHHRAQAEARHGVRFAQLGGVDALERLHHRGAPQVWADMDRALEDLVVACERAALRGDGGVAEAAGLAALAVLARRGPVDRMEAVAGTALQGAVERRSELLALRGLARLDVGKADDALQDTYVAVASASGAMATGRRRGDLAVVLQSLGRLDDAREQCELAMGLGRRAGDRVGEAVAMARLGSAELAQGDSASAETTLRGALELLRSEGVEPQTVGVLRALGAIAMGRGHFDEARRTLSHAMEAALGVGSVLRIARVTELQGLLAQEQGDLAAAGERLHEALAAFLSIGDRRAQAVTIGHLALLALWQGHLDEGEGLFQRARQLHRAGGNTPFEGVALVHLGALARTRGDMDTAEQRLQGALTLFRASGNGRGEGLARTEAGVLALDRGFPEDARDQLSQAVALLEASDTDWGARRASVELARAWVAGGEPARALEILATVSGDHRIRSLALATRAQALLAGGDDAGARRAVLEALAVQTGDPMARAEVLVTAAEVRTRLNDREAEVLVEEARVVLVQLGLGEASPLRRRMSSL